MLKVLIYMLICFIVLSACTSTDREETEQDSEKKDRVKKKLLPKSLTQKEK